MITECNTEWTDFFNLYILKIVCGSSIPIFEDFINCILTLYINKNANLVCVFNGQGGQGKSLLTTLISYIVEGKEKRETTHDDKWVEYLEEAKCHEYDEFANWKKYIETFKSIARRKNIVIKRRFKGEYQIPNDKVLMITTNNTNTINTQEQVIRQYLFANIQEDWGGHENSILARTIQKYSIKHIATQFLCYVFSFFKFENDYTMINRMGPEILNDIAKNYDKEGKMNAIYDEHIKDASTHLYAKELLKLLNNANILEGATKFDAKTQRILNAIGYKYIKIGRDATGILYTIQSIENN